MALNLEEIRRRESVARKAIKAGYETDLEELNVRLFVSHHLAELSSAYWKRHLSADHPSPNLILDLLVLQSHWGGEDEIETFDFTLPEEITNYVLGVKFDDAGDILDISMES